MPVRVNRSAGPPVAGTRQMSRPPARLSEKLIHLPSRDQVGAV